MMVDPCNQEIEFSRMLCRDFRYLKTSIDTNDFKGNEHETIKKRRRLVETLFSNLSVKVEPREV